MKKMNTMMANNMAIPVTNIPDKIQRIDREHYTMSMDKNRVVHVHFDTQYHLTSSFMRLQEFYESPMKNIRGNFFFIEEFMDKYAEVNKGKFTYFTDWVGFNVPGIIVTEFWEKFKMMYGNLTPKERLLVRDILKIADAIDDENNLDQYRYHENWNKKFYVIGTYGKRDTRTMEHEYAHAMYYLFPRYKKEMNKLNRELPDVIRKKIEMELKSLGYHRDIYGDEIQAFVSSESVFSLESRFELKKFPKDLHTKYRHVFEKHFDKN